MKLQKTMIVVLASLSVTSAFAQKSIELYQPAESTKDQGISLKGWGSGTISQTDETFFVGSYSLRISTRSFFQGGSITFGQPSDVSTSYTNKNNLLRFTYKIADGSVQGGAGRLGGIGGGRRGGGFPGGGAPGGGGFPGGAPGGGRFPGAGFPGGGAAGGGDSPAGGGRVGGGFPGGGQGFPGAGIGRPGGAGEQPVLKNLRLIVTTSDGKKSEAYVPIATSFSSDEQGWRQISVPLQAITGLDRTNKTIKSIALSADTTATFYVGALGIVNDATPIQGDIEAQDLNLAEGDEVVFSANGSGGSTPLKFSWDFDQKDGIQVDAEGQSVTRKFRKPGQYTITLTISDLYGLKEPCVKTVKVVVNP
jgi:hypothetical protein